MSTGTRKLQEDQWIEYFGSIAPSNGDMLATVEVVREPLNASLDAAGRPLSHISYDPSSDVLEVAVRGRGGNEPRLRYFISGPRSIRVAESNRVKVILVEDRSGALTLIRLFDAARTSSSMERHRMCESSRTSHDRFSRRF